MKSRHLVIMGALLGGAMLPLSASAQLNPPEMPRPEGGLGLLSYERYLEESLDRGLSAYLGPERFIVQVKAVLSDAVTAPRATFPQALSLPLTTSMPPAALPFVEADEPPVLPGLSRDTETRMPMAPAAPAYPPPMAMPAAPADSGSAERKIDRLRVSVVLPSGLSSQDEDFIRNMVMQKVDHQLARDLSIDITRRDFPAQPEPLRDANGIPAWLWLLLAGAGGLGLGLLVSRRRRPDATSLAPVTAAAAPLASGPAVAQAPTAESLRHELTVLLLGEPELAERYMGQLLSQELGVERAAVLTRALGPTVSRRLFPGVNDATWSAIELKQFERAELPSEEAIQALGEAIRTIVRERHAGGPRAAMRRQAPFAFLETLDDSQILYILQEESPRVQALAYSQLPPHRAIGLMQLMNPGELGAVTAAMGDLASIPLAAFQDIALHLAGKATEAPRFSTSVTNGIDLLVGLLDHSDRQMEKRILEELSTQNPEVLKQVRQNYLAFDDIPKLPKEALRDAVRDFPKEQLAEILRDAPANVVSALTGALNDRGRQVVEEALKGPALLDATPGAREAMRRDLLGRIRQTSRVLVIPQAGGK